MFSRFIPWLAHSALIALLVLAGCGGGSSGGSGWGGDEDPPPDPLEDTWYLHVVDPAASTGYVPTAIGIDDALEVKISYCDFPGSDLRLASGRNSTWTFSTVESTGNHFGSDLIVDPNGKVHIVFPVSDASDLKYATDASGSMQIHMINPNVGVGPDTAIALDADNNAYVSYLNNGNLYYGSNRSGSWLSSLVDSSASVGSCSSIALDSNSNIHISYHDMINKHLKYATNASGAWQLTTVDTAQGVGIDTSIAIDSNDKAHISYTTDATGSGNLKYATNASGAWVIEVADASAGYTGTYSSIVLDVADNAHIAYHFSSQTSLMYANNVSGTWGILEIDNTASLGAYCSLAIDADGKMHISYSDGENGAIKYATNRTIPTDPPTAPSGLTAAAASCTSMALAWDDESGDEDGFKIESSPDGITFTEIDTVPAGTESYVHTGLTEDTQYYYQVRAWNIAGDSAYTGIAEDTTHALLPIAAPSGLAAAAQSYFDIELTWTDNSNNEDGFKIERSPDGITFTEIDTVALNVTSYTSEGLSSGTQYYYQVRAYNTGGNSAYSNIADDTTVAAPPINAPTGLAASVLHTSFPQIDLTWTDNSGNEDGFKIERSTNGVDFTQVVTRSPNTTSWSDTGIDTATLYFYRVRAYNAINDSLYSNTDSALTFWAEVNTEVAALSGEYNSIAMDSNGKFWISYSFRTPKDLKFATNESGSWVYNSIETTGQTGEWTSIALDSNDKAHISYYDEGNTGLKYATNTSGSWAMITIDSADAVGTGTSIAVDSLDKIHISYYDSTNTALKYATDASGSWAVITIDSTDDVGVNTSIAVDSNDKLHIAYRDITNSALKYATDVSGSWQTYTLDSTDVVGTDPAIAVDSADKIHISYHDSTNHALKYATDVSGSWLTYSVDISGVNSSIAIDSNDKPHISHYDTVKDELRYSKNTSGTWESAHISRNGAFADLVVDSLGNAHISLYCGAILKYMTNE